MPHDIACCAAAVVVAMVAHRHRTRRLQRLAEMERERDLHARLAQREIESRAETARRRAEVQARHDGEVERFLLQQRQAFQEENRTKIEEFRQDEDAVPEFLRHFVRSGKVNIAVLGSPGAGKTSFISVHGRAKKIAACAKVGAEECARRPTPYVTESGDVLWDLPVSDTQDLSYLRFFDAAVLVTMDRFTEAERAVERALERFQVPCLCVRNKVDLALDWIGQEEDDQGRPLEDERTQALEQETLQQLRRLFQRRAWQCFLFTSSRANSSTDLRSTPTGFAEISALLCRILKPSGRVRFAWSGSLSSVGPNSASVESQCVTIRGVVSATGTEFVVVQFVVASCSDALTFIKSDLNSLKFRGHARLWPTRHFCDHILFVFRAPSQSQPFQIRRRSHLRVFFLRNLSLSAEV